MLKKVESALEEVELPAGALEALLKVLPHSLSVAKDERHEFQERALDMVEKVLESTKTAKEQAIPAKQMELEETQKAKATQEVVTEKAKEECGSAQKACEDSKCALAEVAQEFQQAKRDLTEVQTKLFDASKESEDAITAKEALEGLLRGGVQSRAAEILEVKEFLKSIGHHLEIDSTMMSALSLALARAPDARSNFDELTIKDLEEKGARKIAERTEVIEKSESTKVALTAAAADAEAKLAVKKEQQIKAAVAYTKAAETATAAETTFKEAKKAKTDSAKAANKAIQDHETAQALYDLFAAGPIEDFRKLRERLSPVPEVTPAAAEFEEDGMRLEGEQIPTVVAVAA
jgi:myosin heavy subunit